MKSYFRDPYPRIERTVSRARRLLSCCVTVVHPGLLRFDDGGDRARKLRVKPFCRDALLFQ